MPKLAIKLAGTARKMVDHLLAHAEKEEVDLHGLTADNICRFLDDAFGDGGEARNEHFADIGFDYSGQFGRFSSKPFTDAQAKVEKAAVALLVRRLKTLQGTK